MRIFSIKNSGNVSVKHKIGEFCQHRPNSNETLKNSQSYGIIVATLEHKLQYQLLNWDGYQLMFRFNPFRVTMKNLYNEQTSTTDAATVEKAKLMILTNRL